MRYSIFALSDLAYRHFCTAGKDYDRKLKELGATSISPPSLLLGLLPCVSLKGNVKLAGFERFVSGGLVHVNECCHHICYLR